MNEYRIIRKDNDEIIRVYDNYEVAEENVGNSNDYRIECWSGGEWQYSVE